MSADELQNDKNLLLYIAIKTGLNISFFRSTIGHIANKAAFEFRFYYKNPIWCTVQNSVHRVEVPYYQIEQYYAKRKKENVLNVKNDIMSLIK